MSKNVSIEEGNRARNFGPTAKIKTELQGGGYCYWVPEDERETGMVFASKNREYTPDEIDKYGIDEIDINIIFTGIDPDGNPWSVTIDPDTGFPVIEYPDSDIEMLIDPETGNVIIKPIDGIEPIAEIDGDLLGDMGVDPLSDVDMTLDDLGDLDDLGSLDVVGEIDGIPSIADLDLDDLDWKTENCPTSFRLAHVPNKTSYKDGETIDLDGLVAETFDENGNFLGYVPAHELTLNQSTANYSGGKPVYELPDYSDNVTSITSMGNASWAFEDTAEKMREATKDKDSFEGLGDIQGRLGGCDGKNVVIVYPHDPPTDFSGAGVTSTFKIAFIFDPLPSVVTPGQAYPGTYIGVSYNWGYDQYGVGHFVRVNKHEWRGNERPFCGEKDGAISTANMTRTGGNTNNITVGWTSPCFQSFSGSFTISVSEDHGGSHYGGKF